MKDKNVHSPKHYTQGEMEVIDAMVGVFGMEAVKTYCLLNNFKYISRHKAKNGQQDLEKANWYLRFAMGDDPRKDK